MGVRRDIDKNLYLFVFIIQYTCVQKHIRLYVGGRFFAHKFRSAAEVKVILFQYRSTKIQSWIRTCLTYHNHFRIIYFKLTLKHQAVSGDFILSLFINTIHYTARPSNLPSFTLVYAHHNWLSPLKTPFDARTANQRI